jgi:hypothetical protein
MPFRHRASSMYVMFIARVRRLLDRKDGRTLIFAMAGAIVVATLELGVLADPGLDESPIDQASLALGSAVLAMGASFDGRGVALVGHPAR